MATLRMTGAAVLDTAITTATAIGRTVETIGEAAYMLNKRVKHASAKQDIDLATAMVGYKDSVLSQRTVEIAQSRKVLADYKAANPDQSDLLEQIWSELEAALA